MAEIISFEQRLLGKSFEEAMESYKGPHEYLSRMLDELGVEKEESELPLAVLEHMFTKYLYLWITTHPAFLLIVKKRMVNDYPETYAKPETFLKFFGYLMEAVMTEAAEHTEKPKEPERRK